MKITYNLVRFLIGGFAAMFSFAVSKIK